MCLFKLDAQDGKGEGGAFGGRAGRMKAKTAADYTFSFYKSA